MLNLVKSFSKRQKRGILLTLDSILVVLSIMFAIVAQGLPGGLVDNMISYVPVLPYVLLVGIGVSMCCLLYTSPSPRDS